jgi:hypothetical protein
MDFPQSFGEFFFLAFWGLMTLVVGVFAFIAHAVRGDFKEMSQNLHNLTVGLASLAVKLDSLDARLEKLERVSND